MAMLSLRLEQTKQVHAKDVLSVATNTLKILMEIEKEMTKKKPITNWQVSILQSRSVSLINFYTDDIPLDVAFYILFLLKRLSQEVLL